MLRAVVGTFLDSLTEREFDGPLLAILAAQGFTDVHFIHGAFEFGKDVIAKRPDSSSGEMRQYVIQSKAGDIGQSDWRSIRPQLEECEYNTLGHPSFDESLPRVAVLVTTGRMKGSAPTDAQAFRKACRSRGLADFEVWERSNLLDWLCLDPSLGMAEVGVQDELIGLLSTIRRRELTEPRLERHTRHWLSGDDEQRRLAQASIETSLICTELVATQRLDMAALAALHLYRAAWAPADEGRPSRSPVSDVALRLFTAYATDLLNQATELLDNPNELANSVMDVGGLITYPAACCRLGELFGLLALTAGSDVASRAQGATLRLASRHPGTARPPSDHFAASLIPMIIVLAKSDRAVAAQYLRSVSEWLLDRHDPDKDGLGLGSLDEDERTQFERLVAGSTTLTELEIRYSSYLASVVLDALWAVEAEDLYEAVRENLKALRVVTVATAADEQQARWKRGGENVFPQPRIDYAKWTDRTNEGADQSSGAAIDAVILGAVCRSRHYPTAMSELVGSV
jgi:hypothetical protein